MGISTTLCRCKCLRHAAAALGRSWPRRAFSAGHRALQTAAIAGAAATQLTSVLVLAAPFACRLSLYGPPSEQRVFVFNGAYLPSPLAAHGVQLLHTSRLSSEPYVCGVPKACLACPHRRLRGSGCVGLRADSALVISQATLPAERAPAARQPREQHVHDMVSNTCTPGTHANKTKMLDMCRLAEPWSRPGVRCVSMSVRLCLINHRYGFKAELVAKWGKESKAVYALFRRIFSMLPLGALIQGKTLVMHGGKTLMSCAHVRLDLACAQLYLPSQSGSLRLCPGALPPNSLSACQRVCATEPATSGCTVRQCDAI